MAMDADALVDRRRLKRRLAIWRVLAVGALVAVVAVAFGRFGSFESGPHVGVLWVEGLILSDPYRDDAIAAVIDDPDIEALIVRIDSPGGGTFASETLYRGLKEVAAEKPVVAVMEGVAASGGYMAAIAADHIVARETTVTGSIGVIMTGFNLVELLDMIGIEDESIRSGPFKARPDPSERMSPEVRELTQKLIGDVHDMFVGMVADSRDLDIATVETLADGRIYTGRMAVDNRLIDGLGGMAEARAWLEATHDIDPELPEYDIDIPYPDAYLSDWARALFGKSYLAERLTLDGLVSVWHAFPSVPN